jgi:hypothetical protein
VVFLVEPGTKPVVEQMLARMGGRILNFAVSRTGLEVRSNQTEAGRMRARGGRQ